MVDPDSALRHRSAISAPESQDGGCFPPSQLLGSETDCRTQDNSDKPSDEEFEWEEDESDTAAEKSSSSNLEPTEKISAWNGHVEVHLEGRRKLSASKPTPRRATARDKELCLLVHKAHLLCLLARGRLVDAACSDPLLQASLLSILPRDLIPTIVADHVSVKGVSPLVTWFRNNFQVLSTEENKLDSKEGFVSKLRRSLAERAGTAEEVTALSVALFRCLGFTTRYISVLDVGPVKPDAEFLDATLDWQPRKCDPEGFRPVINDTYAQLASLAQALAQSTSQCSLGDEPEPTEIDHLQTSLRQYSQQGHGICRQLKHGGRRKVKKWSEQCVRAQPPNTLGKAGLKAETDSQGIQSHLENGASSSSVNLQPGRENANTRGDIELERNLAMAVSATAAVAELSKPVHESPPFAGEPLKEGSVLSVSSGRRAGLCSLFSNRKKGMPGKQNLSVSGSTWSRNMGPLLHWAEIFCGNEGVAGRWVHVDAGKGIVDGIDKVRAAAVACRLPLRYVVAFAGFGAKDVTKRYVSLWSLVMPLRVDEKWLDVSFRPLKCLEAAATSCCVNQQVAGAATTRYGLDQSTGVKASPNGTLSTKANGLRDTNFVSAGPHRTDCTSPCQQVPKCDPADGKLHKVGFRRDLEDRGAVEDIELETRVFMEPLPTRQQVYKNHHLYVLEKWLTKYQALYPKGPVLGYCAGQPVYPRSCVKTLHTAEHWLRECRSVIPGEAPYKLVARSHLAGREENSEMGECTVSLFGRWQTEGWRPPPAANGVVPKNDRGQIDVWSEKCLPSGTVHLRYPRLVPVARRLGVDYAPAFVGFEIHKGRSLPKFDGIVVCKEFQATLLEAYCEEERLRADALGGRLEEQAILRWRQLLRSVATRERLRSTYLTGQL